MPTNIDRRGLESPTGKSTVRVTVQLYPFAECHQASITRPCSLQTKALKVPVLRHVAGTVVSHTPESRQVSNNAM
jgi:ribosomal protein S10